MFGKDNGLKDDTSFLEEGLMDSTAVLELVTFIEENFGITIDDDDMMPENLDSVNNVIGYLKKKRVQS
jgi:acyl carrier protein